MKRFITSSDVEFVSLTGQRTLYIDEDDVVTSVAREMAEKLGILITQRSEHKSPSPSLAPSPQPPIQAMGNSERESLVSPWVPREFLEQPVKKIGSVIPAADLVLRNGTIVWPGQGVFRGDLYVSQGKILALCQPEQSAGQGKDEIDLDGKFVLPGVIDPHVHLGIFAPFEIDARVETKAGLWGGVTTLGCYLYERESYGPKLDELYEKVKTHSPVDIFFHLTIANPLHLEEIPRYVREYGIRSFKIYMSGVPGIIPDIDDGFMTRVYQKLIETGERCTVCIHAENASLVRWATEEIMAKDGMKTSVQEWSETHPAIAEEEAIRRAAFLTREFEQVRTYFVHVSTREGARAVSEIKAEVPQVYAETTSPYLLFSIEKAQGNLPKWLPPLRDRESVEALWEILKKGKIDSLGTDTVPMSKEIKGLEKSVWEAMPNLPSVEHHVPGILTEGVVNRKIPIPLLADIMARKVAEIFSIFPKKGSLMPGSDADLIVVDLDRWKRVRKEEIRSGTPFSLYEDRVLTGWPSIVVKGGRLIVKDGRWVADPPPAQVLNERRG